MSLAKEVDDWLLRRSLGEPKIEEIFSELCLKLSGIGIPIARGRLNWPTLHPLFRAEMVKWNRGGAACLEHFHHQETNSEAWQTSPLKYMLDSGINVLRRRLAGKGALRDFSLFEELAEEGYTDYIAFQTGFMQPGMSPGIRSNGVFVIWATDRPSGFTEEDLDILKDIQLTFALVCKTVIQSQIMINIAETYLGRQAGRSVLDGNIRLGDGKTTKALVWYSDLRDSTRLTGTMSSDDFLSLLNDYFECAARPAIRAGGEVLAFIGDAVLIIFPLEEGVERADIETLLEKVIAAIGESIAMRRETNIVRSAENREPIRFGIGLNIGHVVFGNIGVPERLAFTVIGPTVTEVERLEKMTKNLDADVLASARIASFAPKHWISVGHHRLDGVDDERELFALRTQPVSLGEPLRDEEAFADGEAAGRRPRTEPSDRSGGRRKGAGVRDVGGRRQRKTSAAS